ncbi:hypothetical protein H9651_02450 [Microbacterium sp. Sa4CUA7]|uniref:DUF4064 domain-containing protein n=2 Tax=Microbacterium pullorum TaxID=2762236 RepID=A0ABR8RZJ7_9MICO|nr:hypothetical protein [Microbacterium pullorum]
MATTFLRPLKSPTAPRFSRRAEMWTAGIGLAASSVLQGGFVLAVTRSDAQTVESTIVPAMRAAGIPLGADAHVALDTLAGWFGYSLLLTAMLCAVGFFLASRRPRRRSTGWWFFAAGMCCLVGTQLVLYPVAFLFFFAAGLFALRTPHDRSPQ